MPGATARWLGHSDQCADSDTHREKVNACHVVGEEACSDESLGASRTPEMSPKAWMLDPSSVLNEELGVGFVEGCFARIAAASGFRLP